MGDIEFFYPEFVPNQILTNTQLNQLREHLEQQERLTRMRLTGMGIVCGLNWEIATANTPSIQIDAGFGLSSEGELIGFCDPRTYTHFRDYKDPDRDELKRIRYEPWRSAANPEQQLSIIELLESPEPTEKATGFSAANLAATVQDRVLVLYLEHQPIELNSCLVTSCDNKGRNINVNLRALLVRESDLDQVARCSTPPELHRIPRLQTKKSLKDVRSVAEIDAAYDEIIKEQAPPLGAKIDALFARYARFLDLTPFGAGAALEVKLGTAGPSQDRYDALKDVAAAYDEAALAAHALVVECCPQGDFPRHLLLGALDGTPDFRNEFAPSPVRNVVQGDLQRVRNSLLRVQWLVQNISFDSPPAEVTLTPSHAEAYPLGRRGIPYYFTGIPDLLWRPRGRCAVDEDWPWREPPTSVALGTDYTVASFLRVEGHIAREATDALARLEALRESGNAEFDVLCAYMNDPREEQAWLRAEIVSTITRRQTAIEKLKDAIFRLILSGGDETPLDERLQATQQLEELEEHLGRRMRRWDEVRRAWRFHCDIGPLTADYFANRSETLCALHRALGAVQRMIEYLEASDWMQVAERVGRLSEGARWMLADSLVRVIAARPSEWLDREQLPNGMKWSELTVLDLRQQLWLALWAALKAVEASISQLLQEMPKELLAFNLDAFVFRFNDVSLGALGVWIWLRALKLPPLWGPAPASEGIDRPLHPAEEELAFADLLAIARSCARARFSAIDAALELASAKDLSLMQNLTARVSGLEHLAGVSKGGTLVLACSAVEGMTRVDADFSLEGQLRCCCPVSLTSACMPLIVRPDHHVVAPSPTAEGDYQPVLLVIDVKRQLLRLNQAPDNEERKLDEPVIELLSEKSELGARLSVDKAANCIVYEQPFPILGTVDRFAYQVIASTDGCPGLDIGHVLVAFSLPDFGRVSGIVTIGTDSKNPAVGASVTVGTLFTRTDAQGRFLFDGVPPGAHLVRATLNGLTATAEVLVEPWGSAFARLRILDPGAEPNVGVGTVQVVVVDGQQARVASAVVTLLNGNGEQVASGMTNATGEVVFPNVPPGKYVARASSLRLLPGTSEFGSLQAGGRLVLTVTLRSRDPIVVGPVTPAVGARRAAPPARETVMAIDRVYNQRHTTRLRAVSAIRLPDVASSVPYQDALTFMTEKVTDTNIAEVDLIEAYETTVSSLTAAMKKAEGDSEDAYRQVLEAATTAFLDKLTLSSPAGLSSEASGAVRRLSKTLKKAGSSGAELRNQWLADDLGELPIESIGDIGSLLK